ncbi:MAG: LPS assembly lipoprotein LptE [Bacteroidota bacterium]
MRLKSKVQEYKSYKFFVTLGMKRILFFLLIGILFSSCYSFRGVSIPPDVKTFYVRQVRINLTGASLAPADAPERFMEELRGKIRSQSRLEWDDTEPHIEFDCEITSYQVSNEANRQGNEVALNKLSIGVKANFYNNNDPEEDWNKSFTFGIPFDPNEDLQAVQDGYIADIFEQISENIFNEAFTNW